MPDLPIVIPDTAAAPKDYTLSGTQELALKTVRALIDGTGAASAFLPTLQLLDPNGHVMWEGATSSTVAAGGSADVSWFPGLGATGSGTAGIASLPVMAGETFPGTTLTVGSMATAAITWDDVEITDSSVFHYSGGVNLHVDMPGTYAIVLSCSDNTGWPSGATDYIQFFPLVTGTNGIPGVLIPYAVHPAVDLYEPSGITQNNMASFFFTPIASGSTIRGNVFNHTAGNFTIAGNSSIYVWRIGDIVNLP